MQKNYISNSSESTRMFKSSWMEALSKVHYSVPLFIYVPVIAYLSYRCFTQGLELAFYFSFLLLGLAFWTLTEYVLHRYIFHFVPKSKWGLRLHFIFHGVHHDYPKDAKRLVMPPSASIPLATGFYFLFTLFFSDKLHLFAFYCGFIAGYLVYDMLHYAMHHANFKSPILQKVKQHHMLHHYGDSTKGFGVSSSLWDIILQSGFPKKK